MPTDIELALLKSEAATHVLSAQEAIRLASTRQEHIRSTALYVQALNLQRTIERLASLPDVPAGVADYPTHL